MKKERERERQGGKRKRARFRVRAKFLDMQETACKTGRFSTIATTMAGYRGALEGAGERDGLRDHRVSDIPAGLSRWTVVILLNPGTIPRRVLQRPLARKGGKKIKTFAGRPHRRRIPVLLIVHVAEDNVVGPAVSRKRVKAPRETEKREFRSLVYRGDRRCEKRQRLRLG